MDQPLLVERSNIWNIAGSAFFLILRLAASKRLSFHCASQRASRSSDVGSGIRPSVEVSVDLLISFAALGNRLRSSREIFQLVSFRSQLLNDPWSRWYSK